MSVPLHIASLIVHVRKNYLETVKQWVEAFSCSDIQTEIHAESEQGKLVVVIETEDEKHILALIDTIVEQPGVLNSALVYHEIIPEDEV
ncbi:chaperone NapD [Aestuariicella hydrocarbonica]|uniref:Chaperone NapD n=1 Tax=Pseudomaricurvus hydrocarbonicus TaxID=1470433 RepID=A0A9E5JRY6_9GAMM|nr:chaperone NapD [Aestuariicella hydrocarbonica]